MDEPVEVCPGYSRLYSMCGVYSEVTVLRACPRLTAYTHVTAHMPSHAPAHLPLTVECIQDAEKTCLTCAKAARYQAVLAGRPVHNTRVCTPGRSFTSTHTCELIKWDLVCDPDFTHGIVFERNIILNVALWCAIVYGNVARDNMVWFFMFS